MKTVCHSYHVDSLSHQAYILILCICLILQQAVVVPASIPTVALKEAPRYLSYVTFPQWHTIQGDCVTVRRIYLCGQHLVFCCVDP